MPEVFEYGFRPDVPGHADAGAHEYILAGCTCLAGDVFGEYRFTEPLDVGAKSGVLQRGSLHIVQGAYFQRRKLAETLRDHRGWRPDPEEGVHLRLITLRVGGLVSVRLFEQELELPAAPRRSEPYRAHFAGRQCPPRPSAETAVRLVITESDNNRLHCELSVLSERGRPPGDALLRFARRSVESTDRFNAVLLVPTGIGAEIGGHAGDATPVASLLASVCDTLVVHPNVVNASDIVDIPSNALYVEGSVVARLLMGTAGLQRVRSNRVLVVLGPARRPAVHRRRHQLCQRRSLLVRSGLPSNRQAQRSTGDDVPLLFLRQGCGRGRRSGCA